VPDTTLIVVVLGLLPFLLLATTSFAKLSIVFGLLRNAFGPGDVPPGSVVVVLATLLSGYIMLPVAYEVASAAAPALVKLDSRAPFAADSGKALLQAWGLGKEPVRAFLDKHAGTSERDTFTRLLRARLPETQQAEVTEHDLAVVLPAFFLTELKEALQLGFLLLLPFFVLDLVVASLLTSLGMQGLPQNAVALPFKLLLFVSVDGFRTLVETLVAGYR
jgi:type III secretion protein R